MNKKPGRNDPCPCGSGKKHKHCCLLKQPEKRKLKAVWVNAPQAPNLMERAYGSLASSDQSFIPVQKEES